MPYVTPDLGHPLQHAGEPTPFEYGLTPRESDKAKVASIELERKRREANKRDADRDIARLGVVFTDDDPEVA